MSLSTIFLSLFLLFSVLSGTAGELLPGSWKLHKSSEENAGILRYDARIPFLSGKALELDGNFDKGGKSVTAYCDLNPNMNLSMLTCRIQSEASRIAFHFTDSAGRIHQHFIALTGDPTVWQCLEIPITGSEVDHQNRADNGILQGGITRIAITAYRKDFPGESSKVRIADIRTVAAESQTGNIVIPANFRNWTLNRGREFTPGADASLQADGTRLLLKVDNSRHGDYAAAVHRFPSPVNAKKIRFIMRGANHRIALRFTGSDNQVHNHTIDTTGNTSEKQEFTVDITGSKHHWGGKNDGVFRGPLTEVQLVVCGRFFGTTRRGETEFSAVTLEVDELKPPYPKWEVADPTRLFRHVGDPSAVTIRIHPQKPLLPDQIVYSYRDYSGGEVATGSGLYNAEDGTLSAPPPPGRGFFELAWPELGIRLGLAVDDPPPAKADEYFAMDSSLSWGPPPDEETGIRNYLRILKQNGIVWNRDRLSWPHLEPEQGKFDFGGRFGLYRRIAAEEGVKALDTFHATPAWNRKSPAEKKRVEVPYPDNLIAAGESWNTITENWHAMKALEVWNEPDLSFGKRLPAEYATSFTKAVSRTFTDHGNPTLVVGGVFSSTQPGTNFYRSYIANGLLDDSDIISYHTYADVPNMEPQVAALRRDEIESGTPRAGIPYWVTECGKPRPWSGTRRGTTAPDQYSAVEITGKAAELRALGIQRYFAFEYKFRKEFLNNFSMMDINHTPMRSMATYLHLVRVLSHRDYIGDLKGINSVRARVFEGKDDLVAVLYNGLKKSRKLAVSLPEGIQVLRATGIDGRPFETRNQTVSNVDGITYLYLPKGMKRRFVNPDTRAMKLFQLARNYKSRPRSAKPVVLQSITDFSNFIISNRGFYVPGATDVTLKVRANNFGKEPLTFHPEILLPPGGQLLAPPEKLIIGPRTATDFSFRVSLPSSNQIGFQTLLVGDRAGNATPIAFSLAPFHRAELEIGPAPIEREVPKNVEELIRLGSWTDFSGPANWTAWEGDKTIPDIEASFLSFHTQEELVLLVLVRDSAHVNPNSAFDSWRGDSVQLAIQQRKPDGVPSGKYWEVTAAQCIDGQTLYAHIGPRTGLLRNSKLKFHSIGEEYFLYEIRLNGKELGLELKPGSVLGVALLVNSDPGTGRAGFLTWGHGIAPEKNALLFPLFHLR